MQFNSFVFILFLIIVCIVYFLLGQKLKPWFLLFASLFFYGYWEWWAPVFLCVYALINFLIARAMERRPNVSFRLLLLGIAASVFLFVLFRYTGAFDGIFGMLTGATGISIEIVFPIGFSYYMFKNLSYLFDVHMEKMHSEKHFQKYLLYVSYFPEILMGPISRAIDFLPQIDQKKVLDMQVVKKSFLLILIAFAKKLIIADRIASLINPYITSGTMTNGLSWFIICCSFGIQLYLDFSAYTDISIAVSNILGYNIKPNFMAPYFSLTVSDFWRRWHISLSSWLSDYIFTPLQFLIRKMGIFASVVAAMITLLISGLWHGSTLNWILYGLCMGVVIGCDALFAKKRKKLKRAFPKPLFGAVSYIVTMAIIMILYVFIISPTSGEALHILSSILNPMTYSRHLGLTLPLLVMLFVGIAMSIASHCIELKRDVFYLHFFHIPIAVRYIIYLVIIFAILLLGVASNDIYGGFIYAQF